MYDGTEYTQPIALGVDAGLKAQSTSALSQGAIGKKAPQALFSNRVHSKHKGWLAPSIERKIQTRIKTASNVQKMLPTAKAIAEVASLDIQKIKNPYISGAGCRRGGKLGSWNAKEYVLFGDGHACHGRKGCKNHISAVRRIETRRIGGDAPKNLAALCKDCHNGYRDAAFMGIGAPLSAPCGKAEAEPRKRAIFQKRRVHWDYAPGIIQQAEARISKCRHGIRMHSEKTQESETA
ncbi:MAG: RRXRR domain-containing protein [Clostridiales bacterium]|nr:RRXRR domain-containing protein [Clostridiales bacterium]